MDASIDIFDGIEFRDEIMINSKPCRLPSAYITDAPIKKIIQSCIDVLKIYEFEYIQKYNTWHIYYVPSKGELTYMLIELFRVDTESAQFVIDCRTMSGNRLCGIQLKKQLINMITDVYVIGSEPIDLTKSSFVLPLPIEIEAMLTKHKKDTYDNYKTQFITHINNLYSIENNLMYLGLFLTEYSNFTNIDHELIGKICEFISTNFTCGYITLIYILRDLHQSSLDNNILNEIIRTLPEFNLYINGIIDGSITHEMYHVKVFGDMKVDIKQQHILIWRTLVKFARKVIDKLSHK